MTIEDRGMSAKDFLKLTYLPIRDFGEYQYIHLEVRPRLKLRDGFEISMQAGYALYCSPRISLESGDYSEVELGYPSEIEPMILEYAEDKDDPLNTIYPYVPIEVVEKIVEKHGGIVSDLER